MFMVHYNIRYNISSEWINIPGSTKSVNETVVDTIQYIVCRFIVNSLKRIWMLMNMRDYLTLHLANN